MKFKHKSMNKIIISKIIIVIVIQTQIYQQALQIFHRIIILMKLLQIMIQVKLKILVILLLL
jgi:hypothetical protein